MKTTRYILISILGAITLALLCSGCASRPKQKLSLSYLRSNTNGVPEFNVTYQMEPGERVCPHDAFMISSILLDGVARHPPMDGVCSANECPTYPENTQVRFPISLDSYCYIDADETAFAPSGATLSPGKHSLVIRYAGHQSKVLPFTVKARKKRHRDR